MALVLIAGCGYVGTALGNLLSADGHTVWGMRRNVEALPPSIRPLAADLTRPETLASLPPNLDFIFYTAAAGGPGDEAYRLAYVQGVRHLLGALRAQGQSPRRIFFTSSTSVYAQSSGEWVDEASPAEPVHSSGSRVLEGEGLLLNSSYPVTILRLGGIYGPTRARLIDSVRMGTATCDDGPPTYANRIHLDDCAGALRHLMGLKAPGSIYLGVDNEPADQCAVLRWLATKLGAAQPRLAKSERDMESRAFRSNKRCNNARLIASGYVFRYPTFREGFASLLGE
ncbi:MAG TPA: SDR family oxidoreductase [Blastocatellia bacterium]|jgi:nucleoside-diphosphate-sugar epimerase|nr:SDR family oxidoreductase [Blastocatellia bacterium]